MASRAPLGVLVFLTAIVYSTAGLFDSCSCEGTLQNIQVQIRNLQTTIDKQSIIHDVRSGNFKLADEKLRAMNDFEKHIPSFVHEFYARSKSSFALLIDWANQSEETVQQEILISLYREMQTLNHQDPDNLFVLAEQFSKKLNSKTVDSMNELGNQIQSRITELLIQSFRPDGNINTTEIRVLRKALVTFYPRFLSYLSANLEDNVNEIDEPHKVLEYVFSQSRRHTSFTNAMLHFYFRIREKGKLSDKFQWKVASILRRIKDRPPEDPNQNPVFEDVIDSDIQYMTRKLPICFKDLLFSIHVCLWNKGHAAFLEASPSLYNEQRRSIDIQSSKNNTSKAAQWLVHEINDKIFLENSAYRNEYLYVSNIKPNEASSMKYVFTWVPGNNTDTQSAFDVELGGEYCYLKSSHFNEYLFVANSTHELVTGSLPQPVPSDEYLWQIRGC